MTDSGAERAARRIARRIIEIMRSRGLIFSSYSGQWDDVLKEDEIAAIIREETGTQERELFGRAMVIIKGLTLGTDWEIAPAIKREMEQLCADVEALAAPDEGGTR